ncbi:MAG: hypothetical protein F6K56_01950 [Moorea sp. SIO3G5]|nr:hypothetical protein [Moorena sp. SIO3G5]
MILIVLWHGYLAVAWVSCRGMGIWLWNGHLAVEWASWWNGHLARFIFQTGSMPMPLLLIP